jgi:very-short-patch-repair endonuclease
VSDSFPPDPAGAWSTRQIKAHSHWRRARQHIEDELLTHPWRGVYCVPDADLITRLSALQLAVGTPLVACHQTAAALHGFGVLDDGLLHVTTPDGRSVRGRAGVRLHQWVPRATTGTARGLAMTAAADTAVDVAATAAEIDILPVLDAALTHRITGDELIEAVDRAKGRRGIAAVRRWSEFADGRAQSPMESRTRYRLISAGLPAPDLQIRVGVPGGTRWIDMGWEETKIGLEYDGEDFHNGDGRLARDRKRHNQLTRAGWTIVHATASDIWRHPDPLIDQLRGLLPRAA